MAEVVIRTPSFLYSEEGLVLKTVGLSAATSGVTDKLADEVDADGFTHKIAKAGTIISTENIKGLLFEDIDVTGSTEETQKAASVMVAGHYINDTSVLPELTTESEEDFKAQGLFGHKAVTVTRPAEE